MVFLEDDFLRAGATGRDSLRVGRPSAMLKARSWSDEIDSAACDVERALDATHAAIALNRAATGGNSQVTMSGQ